LSFITSFDEPVIALFISGTKNITLPKAMWDGIRYEINPSTLAVSSLVILVSGILTIATLKIKKPDLKNE
jgi:putative spermidine/putrescine transport system permease protein